MPSISTPALKILVIDDEALCVRALSAMLAHLGQHEVSSAEDGDTADALLRQQRFDLILCDLRMPGRDGVETLRLLAKQGVEAGIVLLSGSDPRLLRTAQELGKTRGLLMLGTLSKPIALSSLQQLLASLTPELRPASVRRVELQTEAALSQAIESDQLRLHYQPQLDLRTHEVTGVEALVRWEHPHLGLLSPDAFIPVAEACELIEPLTDWVLAEAISQSKEWRDAGLNLGMSINLSARSLRRLDLPDRLDRAVSLARMAPAELTLEVTETGVTDDVESMLDITTRLRLKGFALSIDDFGTGFSNLKQLQRLPFTELKLDRTFVQAAVSDRDSAALLRSSVELANRLQLDTVAEGIETGDEWALLKAMGVQRGQGFYMGRPMPAAKLQPWLQAWRSSQVA